MTANGIFVSLLVGMIGTALFCYGLFRLSIEMGLLSKKLDPKPKKPKLIRKSGYEKAREAYLNPKRLL